MRLSFLNRVVLSKVILGLALVGVSDSALGICGLDGVVREQLRNIDDPQTLRVLSRKVLLYGTCSACHLAKFGGPRNEYGSAVNALLTRLDREDPVRQREAARRLMQIPANPALPNSPTFGELFRLGRFPADSIANQEPPLPEVATADEEIVTAEQVRMMIARNESESSFSNLQLSRTSEITVEVAKALAEFRGDTLILGIKSLSPEVAAALSNSRAENLWLHSVTSVSPAAAAAIVQLQGHLILSGLTQLDSVPLAEKLAARPEPLSLPFIQSITPEIAVALATHPRSLILGGLTEISSEVEEELAQTVGTLSLPNLVAFRSVRLAGRLAATAVVLPKAQALSKEQLELLVGEKGQASFWGGVYLPTTLVTPEIAEVLASIPRSINLTLVGDQPLADESLRILLRSRCRVTLQGLQTTAPEQVRIFAEEIAEAQAQATQTQAAQAQPNVLQFPALSLPSLKTLDSPQLAVLLAGNSTSLQGVTSVSPTAAAALGRLPPERIVRADGSIELRPAGNLSLLSLEELPPETARLLFRKQWLSVSLPSLREISPETLRLIASKTFRLSVGISTLTAELAAALAEFPTDSTLGGGYLSFPQLNDLSPEAAQVLVASLNRGVQVLGNGPVRISPSPKLYFGGDLASAGSGFPRLSPELAVELAKYEGILAIQGLRELPDASAAALASFPGPYLILSGPGAEKLSQAAAASLAKVVGVLQIELRELDSIPLASRFAQQTNWTLSNLETVSKEAAPALSQYRPFFNIRALTVLDSPEIARRLVEGTTSASSITLPALSKISPEAARILAAGNKPMLLGLRVIDSPEVLAALAQSRSPLSLPRIGERPGCEVSEEFKRAQVVD